MSDTGRGEASGSNRPSSGSDASRPGESPPPVYGPIPTGPQAHAQPLERSGLPEGVRLPAPGEPLPPAPVPLWAPPAPKPPKKSLIDRLGLHRLGLQSKQPSPAAAAPTPLAAAAAATQEASPYAPPGLGAYGGYGDGPPTAVLAPVPVGGVSGLTDPLPKISPQRRTRKARLRLARLDPWSVMKTAFLFSIAGGIMMVVGVYVVWTVLEASQLFTAFNDIVKSVLSTPGDTTPFRVEEYVNTQRVMGVTALLACVNVVIFTALATLGSFLYNLAATMLGGLEVTLAED